MPTDQPQVLMYRGRNIEEMDAPELRLAINQLYSEYTALTRQHEALALGRVQLFKSNLKNRG